MKIAHIVSTFPPYKGGMGNAVFAMATELTRLAHEVTVFTPYVAARGTLVDTRVPLAIRYMRPLLRFGNAALVPQLFLDLDPFDIIHLHYPFFGGAEFVWLHHLTRPKQPLVVAYQMDAVADGIKGKMFQWYNHALLPRMLRSAARVVVTTSDYADHSLLRAYPDLLKDKRVEIGLGVDTVRFQPREKASDVLHTILFVGGLDRAHAFKGVDILLRAFKFLLEFERRLTASVRLVIVGDGDLRSSYEALARELGITDHVLFVGSVSSNDLPQYYTNADVLVLPSTTAGEAFGLVLLEAFASGRPVIASNLPGVRTLVREGQNGFLVKPGDIVGLGKALNDILRNPLLTHAMGERGRKIVETEYQWENVGKKLDELYRNVHNAP